MGLLVHESIRIGDEAIAAEEGRQLRADFAADYVLHRPAGALSFDHLRAYFASFTSPLSAICESSAGDHRGLGFPGGTRHATPRVRSDRCLRVQRRGRLAEEWAHPGFLTKLGVTPPRGPNRRGPRTWCKRKSERKGNFNGAQDSSLHGGSQAGRGQ